MEQMTLLDILMKEGVRSPAMWLLGACSLATFVVLFERGWYFLTALQGVPSEELAKGVVGALASGDRDKALRLCEGSSSAMGRLLVSVLKEGRASSGHLHELYRRGIEAEVLGMEKFIGILGTIGNVAPYIGLFGTVLGVMHAFQELGMAGAAGPSVVMRGISEALIATAVGLFVAIISVISYNYFIRRIKRIVKELQVYGFEVVEAVSRP